MRRQMAAMVAGCLLAFYIGIVMFLFFSLLYTKGSVNFGSAIVFEIIGFVPLAYFVMSNLLSKQIKTGYFVPLIMVTVIYTIVLNVVNIAYIATVPQPGFILLNFILLFIYSLISMPIFVMGKR